MDLQLSGEQLQLRDASRRLLTQRLNALVDRLPDPPEADAAQALADAVALGWLSLGLPEKVGGAGGFEDLVLVHEELGRGLAPSLVTSLGVASRLLLHCDPLPEQMLAALCEGTLLVVPAVGTPVDLRDGRLHGSVPHVVDAVEAARLVIAAVADGTVQLVLVATDDPGVTVTAEPQRTDITSSCVTLDAVPVLEVLTADGEPVLRRVRAEAAVLAAARAVGGGRAVLARSVEHVTTRHQFDRAIGTFQAVQHQLADVATALDAAGLALARSAWAVETGAGDLHAAAAVAALAAADAFAQATLVAHQLHGGMGFVLDSPLHLWSARAVADPTAPWSRRHLLDGLAESLGLA